MMKKIITFFLVMSMLSCDDGNIDVPEFDFDNVLINNCGNILLSKINETEVLVIELSQDNTENAFFAQVRTNDSFTLSKTGSNTIAYRTFDDTPGTDYFCQNIPPTAPNIVSEWVGSGTLIMNTILTEDDEDTVSVENEDLNGDGNLTNDNTDGDAFADFIDSDDDGDGVLTIDEDIDSAGDPTSTDTDGDGIPNYLDDDDDDDGTLTINESSTNDEDQDGSPDYLDADTTNPIVANVPDPNKYMEIYTSSFVINLLDLANANNVNIQFDTFNYGSKITKIPITDTTP